jgi:hypothetical protein
VSPVPIILWEDYEQLEKSNLCVFSEKKGSISSPTKTSVLPSIWLQSSQFCLVRASN